MSKSVSKITVTDAKKYGQSYNGSALKVIMLRGEVDPAKPVSAANIMARGNNFNWNVPTPVTHPDEINTTSVQETNHGRQEIGTGRVDSVFTLAVNDQMPSWDSIRTDPEFVILEVTGDDHPSTSLDTNGTPSPTILNAFLGCRIVNHSSATVVNQNKILNVEIQFRQKMSGAAWKLKAGSSVNYPADVS